MNDRLSPRRGFRPGLIAAAVFLTGGALGVGLRGVWAAEPGKGTNVPAPLAAKTALLADLQNGFTAIAERLEPSVVSIRVEKTIRPAADMPEMDELFRRFDVPGLRGQLPRSFGSPRPFNARGSGSGIIVRPDGWILTNDHVVDGADKVTVALHDGREFTGTVRRDYRSDLALVKINASGLMPAEFGDSDAVKVGQWAIAFGSPFELNDTMTVGVISARQRQKQIYEGGAGRFYPSLLQTDASINPGNSGGALVDINGRVVGVNVAINSPTGGNVGIGFAIPSNTAKLVADQLITTGKVSRGYLGVKPATLTPADKQRYGATAGALVEQVSDDTPASRAGLQVEDVIVGFDGKPVTDEMSLRDHVSRTAPGKEVQIVVRRSGKEQTLTAKIDAAPDLETAVRPQPAAERTAQPSKLGVRVEPVTAESSKKFNVPVTVRGVVVVEVENGGAAALAGIQPGDVILRANGQSVNSAAELSNAVQGLKSGDSARLVVLREKTRTLLSVPIP
jgi:serine protease Do